MGSKPSVPNSSNNNAVQTLKIHSSPSSSPKTLGKSRNKENLEASNKKKNGAVTLLTRRASSGDSLVVQTLVAFNRDDGGLGVVRPMDSFSLHSDGSDILLEEEAWVQRQVDSNSVSHDFDPNLPVTNNHPSSNHPHFAQRTDALPPALELEPIETPAKPRRSSSLSRQDSHIALPFMAPEFQPNSSKKSKSPSLDNATNNPGASNRLLLPPTEYGRAGGSTSPSQLGGRKRSGDLADPMSFLPVFDEGVASLDEDERAEAERLKQEEEQRHIDEILALKFDADKFKQANAKHKQQANLSPSPNGNKKPFSDCSSYDVNENLNEPAPLGPRHVLARPAKPIITHQVSPHDMSSPFPHTNTYTSDLVHNDHNSAFATPPRISNKLNDDDEELMAIIESEIL